MLGHNPVSGAGPSNIQKPESTPFGGFWTRWGRIVEWNTVLYFRRYTLHSSEQIKYGTYSILCGGRRISYMCGSDTHMFMYSKKRRLQQNPRFLRTQNPGDQNPDPLPYPALMPGKHSQFRQAHGTQPPWQNLFPAPLRLLPDLTHSRHAPPPKRTRMMRTRTSRAPSLPHRPSTNASALAASSRSTSTSLT